MENPNVIIIYKTYTPAQKRANKKFYDAHKLELNEKIKSTPELKEKRIEYHKKYSIEHAEERALYRKLYYQRNREKLIEINKLNNKLRKNKLNSESDSQSS